MCQEEIWKHISKHNLPRCYEVSSFGRTRILYQDHFEILPQRSGTGKYLHISIKGKDLQIHRIVAEEFIPNPDNKRYINHIDKNRQNNHVENLEWVTAAENRHHAYMKMVPHGKRIKCFNTGIIYSSVSSASYHLGIPTDAILASCEDHCMCFGYKFRYVESTEIINWDDYGYVYLPKTLMLKCAKEMSSIEEFRTKYSNGMVNYIDE